MVAALSNLTYGGMLPSLPHTRALGARRFFLLLDIPCRLTILVVFLDDRSNRR